MRDNQRAGESVVGGKRGSKKYPANRTCSHPDCDTRLSRYNPGQFCVLHERSARERLLPPSVD